MKRVLTALTVILLSAIAACRPSPVYTPTLPPTFTPVPAFTPTATQIPPTFTPRPTATFTPLAPTSTPTPIAPTATPTATPEPLIIPNEEIEIRALALNPPRGASVENVLEKAKEAGANYIVITQWIYSRLSGEIAYYDPPKEVTITLIREAHDRGLKVWLNIRTPLEKILPSEEGSLLFELNPKIFNGLSDEARKNFLRGLEPIILEWAKICEREKVEIFTPVASGQLYLLLLDEKAFTWPSELLPRIRRLYSGLLVQKIDLNPATQQLRRIGLTPEIYNFEGWDYVSTDVFGSVDMEGKPIRTFDDWRDFIKDLLNFSLSLNEKFKTKGVILGPEIMVPESGQCILELGTEFWGHGDFSKEEMEAGKVELLRILFEETIGKVKGYSFWSWMPGFEITYFEVMVEKEGQKYHDRIIPGYQGDGPLNLIKCYYLEDCYHRNQAKESLAKFEFKLREGASQAITKAEDVITSLGEFSPLLSERARKVLLKAEEAFEAGKYTAAKYWANEVCNMRELINPAGIFIDGFDEDWVQKYEPLAVDEVGDVPDRGKDLKSMYVTNDEENLYFMVKFAGKPSPDGVCLFFDVNSDDIWDYHVRVGLKDAFLAKTIRPDYHEPIARLQYAYEQVIEFKVPLELMGHPGAVRIQMFSWDEEKSGSTDNMIGFDWMTYKLKKLK